MGLIVPTGLYDYTWLPIALYDLFFTPEGHETRRVFANKALVKAEEVYNSPPGQVLEIVTTAYGIAVGIESGGPAGGALGLAVAGPVGAVVGAPVGAIVGGTIGGVTGWAVGRGINITIGVILTITEYIHYSSGEGSPDTPSPNSGDSPCPEVEVIDIGGTKYRFGIIEITPGKNVRIALAGREKAKNHLDLLKKTFGKAEDLQTSVFGFELDASGKVMTVTKSSASRGFPQPEHFDIISDAIKKAGLVGESSSIGSSSGFILIK